MQKKIIALAIAGLASSAAFAQTNVTIYGLLDASAYGTDGSGAKANYGFLSNAITTSRLGFKGVEDLGNGLKANFNLEQEISLVTGGQGSSSSGFGNGTFNRAANVGLDSQFGSVTLGRQATPTYAAVSASDVLGANSGGLINAWVATNTNSATRISSTASGVQNGTQNIALANGFFPGVGLATPVFAGFQAKYFTSFGQGSGIANTEVDVAGIRDVGLYYSGFGANVRVTHQDMTGYTDLSSLGTSKVKNTVVGADYTIAGVKVAGAWVRTQFDNSQTTFSDTTTWTLGASYQIGKANIGASYTTTQLTEDGADNRSSSGVKQWALLGKYSLSKRTDVYAMYTLADNHGTANLNGLYTVNGSFANSSSGAIAAASNSQQRGIDYSSIAVGVRHAF